MEPKASLQFEVEKLPDGPKGNKVTKVKWYGKLTNANAGQLKEVVKPLLASGGRAIVDLGDVSFVDSSGLGAMVSLKVSAIDQAGCVLEFVNMTPRVLDLLRVTKLTQILAP